MSQCSLDSDHDGDCHICARQGGCVASGGPFQSPEGSPPLPWSVYPHEDEGWFTIYHSGDGSLDVRLSEEDATFIVKSCNHYARLKVALADAVRRPMGVIPRSAIGVIETSDLHSAERRRIGVQ